MRLSSAVLAGDAAISIRLALSAAARTGLDERLALRVQRAGGLVQEQQARPERAGAVPPQPREKGRCCCGSLAQEHSGNGHALLLPTAQAEATLANARLVAILEA
jgi:hypothetical protein